MKHTPKQIAPRLLSGERREPNSHGLPPEIKAGLKLIASRHNESVSWVLEKIVIQWFHFKTPKYKERKREKKS